MERVIIKIFGRVQGVFFRYSVEEKARELGLVGRVRNADDGTVEIVAEGDKKNLKKLVDWCCIGPPAAKVEKIEQNWQPAGGGFKNFDVQ